MKLKVLFSTLFIIGSLGWYMAFSKPLTLDHLSSSMTYNYVRSVVWYHSRGKIKELESILMNDDLSDQMAIKLKINNMLQHRTSVYLREFNTLDAPIWGFAPISAKSPKLALRPLVTRDSEE
ncbi:TPA: hypothetical protein ACGSTT_004628 [Vibrio parahaemolyticus]|uniref:hypothetical protein n=1 Tax=Vibrio parahaemolyticus TaxID=670 RepID=UPI00188F8AC3|nr:hypothetical protein [Vibrio parahaemolyticus]